MNSGAPSEFNRLTSHGFSAWEAAAEFGGRALNFAQALACDGFLAAVEFRRAGDFPHAVDIARLLGAALAIVALALAFPR
jgi:hypothetical protein